MFPANVCNRDRKRLRPALQTFASYGANVILESDLHIIPRKKSHGGEKNLSSEVLSSGQKNSRTLLLVT